MKQILFGHMPSRYKTTSFNCIVRSSIGRSCQDTLIAVPQVPGANPVASSSTRHFLPHMPLQPEPLPNLPVWESYLLAICAKVSLRRYLHRRAELRKRKQANMFSEGRQLIVGESGRYLRYRCQLERNSSASHHHSMNCPEDWRFFGNRRHRTHVERKKWQWVRMMQIYKNRHSSMYRRRKVPK